MNRQTNKQKDSAIA